MGAKRLTERGLRTLGPGRHCDGDGLYLLVSPSGRRSWVLRYQMHGRRRDMGLGPYPYVSLQLARQRAFEERSLVKVDGKDPITRRRLQGSESSADFASIACEFIRLKAPGWRSVKSEAQWTSSLKTYAFPTLGFLPVAEITVDHVLSVLKPIWTEKTETASRVRQRIEAVLSFAIATERRAGDNPAQWKGRLEHVLPAPSKVSKVKHHAALDWREAPQLWTFLVAAKGQAARAAQFLYLTAVRSAEARYARYEEIDLQEALWNIPEERMKNGKPHRVPLNDLAIKLISAQPNYANNGWIFPNTSGNPFSDTAVRKVLATYPKKTTVQGLRSTFRDWAGEATAHAWEVSEMALAHTFQTATEAAYARGDMLVKRRRLMDDWATYLQREKTELANIFAASDERKEG
ncbi:integrase arm-type DNA-binding domain-containing protein [bacterium]|nr:integrase arm-type DNA-binding domain-containing protein [bacterium]